MHYVIEDNQLISRINRLDCIPRITSHSSSPALPPPLPPQGPMSACPPRQTWVGPPGGGIDEGHCVALCGHDVLYRKEDKHFAEVTDKGVVVKKLIEKYNSLQSYFFRI